MSITSFDRTNLKALCADIDAVLKVVAEKHGIILDMGRTSFTGTSFKSSVIGNTKQGALKTGPVPPIASVVSYPGTANLIGRKFSHRGTIYEVTAYYPERPKYKLVGCNGRGTSYKFTSEAVSRGLISA